MAEIPVPEDKPAPPTYGRSALPSLDLNSLMKQALPASSTGYIQPTINRLRDIQTQKTAALDPLRQQVGDRYEANRAEAMAKREAIEPVDIQPWTQKRPENDPMRSFGSLGSVFAQIASAFTNTPMNNALEGSAAAMKAFRANQLADYEDAHQTWKDNTALALKRHDVQRQEYQDALKLMETDLAGGQAKLTMLAIKYGDDAVAAMNEAGLYKEMNQVLDSRQRSALGLLQVYPRLLEEGIQAQGYLSDPDSQSPDPAKRAAAYQRWFSPLRGLGANGMLNQERGILLKQMRDEFVQKNGREPTVAEETDMVNRAFATGTARSTKRSPFDVALEAIRTREGIEVGKETAEMVAEAQKIAKTGGKLTATELKQQAEAVETQAVIQQLDGLMKQIENDPDIVGTAGKLTGTIQSAVGILNRDREMNTPATLFKSDLTATRERISHLLTGSKYYSEGRKKDMEKILPGLEALTSPQDAYNALQNMKRQLEGGAKEIGVPAPAPTSASPPNAAPSAATEAPKTVEEAQAQGYTEQITSPKTGRIGYRNPKTGKVWVP